MLTTALDGRGRAPLDLLVEAAPDFSVTGGIASAAGIPHPATAALQQAVAAREATKWMEELQDQVELCMQCRLDRADEGEDVDEILRGADTAALTLARVPNAVA